MPRQVIPVAGGVRLYFENYTVDASILKKRTQIEYFDSVAHVISSLQEHTVDALASGAEEGRSNLR